VTAQFKSSGWHTGHPKTGWYYFFRGNGHGVFSTQEDAQRAWTMRFEKDPYFQEGMKARFEYFHV
jgi:hypothetical protein